MTASRSTSIDVVVLPCCCRRGGFTRPGLHKSCSLHFAAAGRRTLDGAPSASGGARLLRPPAPQGQQLPVVLRASSWMRRRRVWWRRGGDGRTAAVEELGDCCGGGGPAAVEERRRWGRGYCGGGEEPRGRERAGGIEREGAAAARIGGDRDREGGSGGWVETSDGKLGLWYSECKKLFFIRDIFTCVTLFLHISNTYFLH
jgi:hypothetical protein